MRITIQIVQNNILQEVPSIIVSCDNTKYFFNIPSSFQRYLRDHKIKYPKGATYFFTTSRLTATGGLVGLLKTIYTNGSAGSKLYFDKYQYNFTEDTRYKMGYRLVSYGYCDWKGNTRLAINNLDIINDLKVSQSFLQIFDDLNNYIKQNIKSQFINDASKNLIKKNNFVSYQDQIMTFVPIQIQSDTNGNQLLTNFVCISADLKGKVLMNKVQELKIPKKLVGKILQTGSLQIQGKIIKKQDITQKDQPGPKFFIFHINSLYCIKVLQNHQIFKYYLLDKTNEITYTIFLIENQGIATHQNFKAFIELFPKTTYHVIRAPQIVDKDFKIDPYLKPSVQLTKQLNEYFPIFMPDLQEIHKNSFQKYVKNGIYVDKLFPDLQVHIPQRCDQIIVVSSKNQGFKKSKQFTEKNQPLNTNPKNKNSKYLLEMIKQSNQKTALIEIILKSQKKENQLSLPFNKNECNPKVIFLGTASMVPQTLRNVSGILIQLDENNSMIWDCGQGTVQQFISHYPWQQFDKRLLNLRVVFISHIHSDHNEDILYLMSRRNRLMKKYKDQRKLFMIIPCNTFPWVDSFCQNVQDLKEGCQILYTQTITNQEYDLAITPCGIDRQHPQQDNVNIKKLQKPEKQIFNKKSEQKKEKNKKQSENSSSQNDQQSITDNYLNQEQFDLLNSVLTTRLSQEKNQIIMKKISSQIGIQNRIYKDFRAFLKSINIIEFLPVHVIHCNQAYGIIMSHKSGIKISYSGDTRPSQQFAKASNNSTLMIHQATFGDDLQWNAFEYAHSTLGQAIDTAMKANSYILAATHFSQRYVSCKQMISQSQKRYKMEGNDKKFKYLKERTILCFDHCQILLSQIPKLPIMSSITTQLIPSQD